MGLVFSCRRHCAGARCEHLIEASVPAAGADAALIAVYDSAEAAQTFVNVMNRVISIATAADGQASAD